MRKALSKRYITDDKTHRPLIFACLWVLVKTSHAVSDPAILLAMSVPIVEKMDRMSQDRDAGTKKKSGKFVFRDRVYAFQCGATFPE